MEHNTGERLSQITLLAKTFATENHRKIERIRIHPKYFTCIQAGAFLGKYELGGSGKSMTYYDCPIEATIKVDGIEFILEKL